MSRFLDAYQKWPPHNQMTFAVIVVIVGAVLMFIFGWWAYTLMREAVNGVVIWARGWPPQSSSALEVRTTRMVTTPAPTVYPRAPAHQDDDEERAFAALTGAQESLRS